MTPERYQEVKRVLEAALEKRPEERTTFLTGACGGDPDFLPALAEATRSCAAK